MPKLKIEIDEQEFMDKTTKEQNLIMYKKMCAIDTNGCSWAQKRNRGITTRSYGIGAAAGVVGGFIARMFVNLLGR